MGMGEQTRRRNWLRFSLRSLLAFMVVVSVLLALTIERARRQRRAIEQLSYGGNFIILYDGVIGPSPPEPAWLANLIGYDWFISSTAVDFTGYDHPLTSQEIKALQLVPNVDRLWYRRETDDLELLREALPNTEFILQGGKGGKGGRLAP
jgi:hypothetical protein